ncbi:MAG: hypothetical protein COA57_03400 [Flavobacteriales bacterium]|nr:MAG: hypothetical protein COA57_03400 [Flavobacteriales bacterium]
MKLGEAAQITIGTPSTKRSFEFYRQLGFVKVSEGKNPNPWVQVTDGTLLIFLNQDRLSYISLTYFSRNSRTKLMELDRIGVNFLQRSEKKAKSPTGTFLSPNKLVITIIEHDTANMYRPKGKTLKDISKVDIRNPEKYPNIKCGVFGEFTHPVKDLAVSVEFWKKVGFELLSINQKPYPWAIVSDDNIILGLHQTKHFKQPAITYFAPDMAERINRLQQEGMKGIMGFGKQNGSIKNAVVKTPEGQQVFLFSM